MDSSGTAIARTTPNGESTPIYPSPRSEARPPLPPVSRGRRRFLLITGKACTRTQCTKEDWHGDESTGGCLREEWNIHHTMCVEWAKQADAMQQAKNSKARSLCPGPCSTVLGCPIQDGLLQYIYELREQGTMPVSISIVMLKAAQLSPAFSQKSRTAQYSATRSLYERTACILTLNSWISALTHGNCRRGFGLHDNSCSTKSCGSTLDQTPIPFTYNA